MTPTAAQILPRAVRIVTKLVDEPAAPLAADGADLGGVALADLGVDSMLLVQFVNELEEEFGIELSDDDLDPVNFATLTDVCDLVARYGQVGHPETRTTTVSVVPEVGPSAAAVDDWPHLGPAARLLSCTAHMAMSDEHIAAAKEILRGSSPRLDWGAFLDLAARHRVLGLVARNFDRAFLGPLGTVRRSTLRAPYLYNRGRAAAWQRERQEILAALSAAGVRVVVRKGSYLVQQVYADPAVRYMEDMDVYVAAGELDGFRAVLAGLGYQQGADSVNRRTVTPLDRETTVFWGLNVSALPPFLRPTSDPYVDVFSIDARRDLMEPASGKSVPAEDFLSRAKEVTLAGERALVPSDEDMLLDLGVHLYREATTLSSIRSGKDLCLIRFIDIQQWYSRVRDTIDVDRLVELATKYDVGAELYYSLHFTEQLYPGSLDSALLSRLRPAELSYLDEYGALDGTPSTWPTDFRHRVFDRHRGDGITAASALLRPRHQWTDDHGAPPATGGPPAGGDAEVRSR